MAEIKRHQITLLSFTMGSFNEESTQKGRYLKPTAEERTLFRELYYSIVCSALEIPHSAEPNNLLKLKIYKKADELLDKPHYRGCEKNIIRTHFQNIGFDLCASNEQTHPIRVREDQSIIQVLADNPDMMFSLTGAGFAAFAFIAACEYISPALLLTGTFGALGALGAFSIFGGNLFSAKKMQDRQEVPSTAAVNFP